MAHLSRSKQQQHTHTAKSQNRPQRAQKRVDEKDINGLSNRVIGCAIKVHRGLGPGFVEKIYAKALEHELKTHEILFSRETFIPVKYEGRLVGTQRLDFLVEDEIVLEAKALYEINNFHMAQALSYLKATDKRLGLILNFARPRLQIRRVAYHL